MTRMFNGSVLKFNGSAIASIAGITYKANGKTVDATPKAALAPGQYMVMWYAVAADDGHKTNGDYNFTVK